MSGWWRYSVTFAGPADNRHDAMARLRALLGDLPVRGLHLSATPMTDSEVMRVLDRDSAKRAIESDQDSGAKLTELGIAQVTDAEVFGEQGMIGGMIPAPGVHHPWIDGDFIFPPEHPLAAYERLARDQHDHAALNQLKELAPGDPES